MKVLSLFLALGCALSILCCGPAESGHPKPTYEELAKRLPALKVGMTASEVVSLLGEPTLKENGSYRYDFTAYEGFDNRMPLPGEQRFYGVEIPLKDGKVAAIHWAWIDATGPAPRR